jgi:type IV pilus assembly protein PilY1
MDSKFLKASITTALASLIFTIGAAHADDTDVYMNPGAGLPEGSEPMIMFSLDYRPNLAATVCNNGECDNLITEGWLQEQDSYVFFDVLRAVMEKVFDPLEGVRVGLMLNHDNINNCEGFGQTYCSNGGYIAMGFELFEEGPSDAKDKFHTILASMPTPAGDRSHSYQGKELFFEFFRYLTGQGVYNAHNGYTDYGTSKEMNLDEIDPDLTWDQPAVSWDTAIETKESGSDVRPQYVTPFDSAGACSKVYTVNLMFGVSNQDADSDVAIEKPVLSGGFGSEQKEFPDVIQYLNDADLASGRYGSAPDLDDKQNVISYFIVDETKITLTRDYARAGGTGVPLALSENPDELVATLQEVLRQILSVSTTFVAASVPVNVFNRAEITDNVFIALFQVDEQKRPSWVGNVKKLKLTGANDSSASATLVDVNDAPAIAADGRIRFDALTYWTDPDTLPDPDLDAGEVAGRDGRVVARGGAGQKIPGFVNGSPEETNGPGGRTIYYDHPTSTTSVLRPLNVDSTTAANLVSDFEVATAEEAEVLIAFARGLDVDDLDDDGDKNDAREWLFGDALHSRPLPINYGSYGSYTDPSNSAIYLAVATNDGMLRMILNTEPGVDGESGREVWAFMPRNAMKAQKTLRENGSGVEHPYTVDGAPVSCCGRSRKKRQAEISQNSVTRFRIRVSGS